MNGTYEAYDFSEIDRSLSEGISIDGNLYRWPNEAIGLGPFAAGGLGILIGDGG